MLSRFHLIPEHYGRTDGETEGRTDKFAISISRVGMLTRDKNSRVCQIHMLKSTVQQYLLRTTRRWHVTISHNFIHLWKRQHNYTQKNESEHLTNQQHETLKKRYLAQSTQ